MATHPSPLTYPRPIANLVMLIEVTSNNGRKSQVIQECPARPPFIQVLPMGVPIKVPIGVIRSIRVKRHGPGLPLTNPRQQGLTLIIKNQFVNDMHYKYKSNTVLNLRSLHI